MSETIQAIFELPHDRVTCEVRAGSLLTAAAAEAGLILNVACGGRGTCGGCAVELLAGRFADASGGAIEVSPGGSRRALACQTRVVGGEVRVRVPVRSLIEAGERIVMDFAHAPAFSLRPPVRKVYLRLPPPILRDQRGDLERIVDELRRHGFEGPVVASVYVARGAELVAGSEYELTVTLTRQAGAWHVIRLQAGDTTDVNYGAAVDVGTTTVAVALVDLNRGEIVDAASRYNQQVIRCDDVASRISYAADRSRIEELRDLVVDETVDPLVRLLARRAGVEVEDVAHMTVAGNTVMSHLFCGLDPSGLGGVPFAPVSNFPGPYRAGQLHLAMNPEGFVDVFPSAAAYVGGDITADMHVCGVTRGTRLTALIDIGTNAEIVVGHRDRLIGCAAPAGPAFEGRGLSCGMRAAAGAIDTVAIDALDDDPRFTVVGDARPAGLCGSGLIDFVAQAFAAGILGNAGRFTDEARRRCARVRAVATGAGEVPAYVLAEAEDTDDGLAPLAVTEADVAAVLQAKGVIFAALQIAMKHFGRGLEDIERLYLAGGFARHIDPDNAVGMGLLPDLPRDRFVFVGNGSLGGAFLALCDRAVREALPRIAAAPAVIELNLDADFMDAYTMAMFLPNADPSLFPAAGGG